MSALCLETSLLVISWDGSNVVDRSCRHLEVTVNGCVKEPYHQNTGSIKMHRVWSVKEGKWAPANWGLEQIDGLVVPRGKASTDRPSAIKSAQEKWFSQTNHIYKSYWFAWRVIFMKHILSVMTPLFWVKYP